MGGVVLVARELYRYGYMTNDGADSKIREAGAYPLNIAENIVLMSLFVVTLRYFFGPFISNRKIVKWLRMSKYDRKLEEVQKKIKEGRPL